jgi:hypothetical protein
MIFAKTLQLKYGIYFHHCCFNLRSLKVRLEGYEAIACASKNNNKWIKQNADVLLQLMQTGMLTFCQCDSLNLVHRRCPGGRGSKKGSSRPSEYGS